MKRVIIIFFLLIASPAAIHADSWVPPESFYILSDDEKYIFFLNHAEDESFPETGLYYRETLVPIFLMETPHWGIWPSDLFFADDMRYFAWIPQVNAEQHNFDASNAVAIVFFAHGEVQKIHMVSNLVHQPDLVRWSVSTAGWQAAPPGMEDDMLTVYTVDGRNIIFDIFTGEIIWGAEEPGGVMILFALIVILGCFYFMRRAGSRRGL